MAITVLRKHWQDVIITPGVRPSAKFVFTDGIVTGFALNHKVFEGFFLWEALAANSSSDFVLFETIVTAAGLQDLLSIEREGKSKLPRAEGAKIIMEVLIGQSVQSGRFFHQIPQNTLQAIHPNNQIGRIRTQLDQIFGWDYVGHESPYNNPTDVSRLIITENIRVESGMRNPNAFPVRNTSRLIFNVIEFQPLDPRRPEDIDRIVDIVKGRKPSVQWSPGLAQSPLQTFLDDFNTEPVLMKDGKVTFNGQVIG